MPTTCKRYIATRKADGALLWAETVNVPDQISDEILSALIRHTLRTNHSRAIGLLDREIDITLWPSPGCIGSNRSDTFM